MHIAYNNLNYFRVLSETMEARRQEDNIFIGLMERRKHYVNPDFSIQQKYPSRMKVK